MINAASADRAPEVREGAAQAIGYGQLAALAPVLSTLLKDSAPEVSKAAAMSLLSFPMTTVGDILRKNSNDSEYRVLFINALAKGDAAPYLTDLAEIIIKRLEPRRFWGGRIPAADSWDILFGYVGSRPEIELQSNKLKENLNALEKAAWYSSSEPRDLYAFYLRHGLTERACD